MADKISILKKVMDFLGNLSIKVKLLILFILLSVLPAVLTGIMSYSKSSNTVETKLSRYSLQILEQTSENINQMLKGYEMISYTIAKNTEIIQAINKPVEAFDIDDTLMVRNYLQNIINARRDEIASIFLYSTGGREFHEGDTLATAVLNYQRSNLYKDTMSANGRVVWTTSSESPEEFRSKGYLVISRLLKNPVTQQSEGSILIFLKEKTIENLYSKFLLEKGGVIFLLDREGRVVSHPNKDLLGKMMLELKNTKVLQQESGCFKWDSKPEKRFVSYWTLNKSKGWKMVSVIPYKNLMKETESIRSTSIGIVLVCIFFSIVCAYFISSKLSKPIIHIAEDISSVEKEYGPDLINKLEEMKLIDVESALQIIKSVEDKTLGSMGLEFGQEIQKGTIIKNNEVNRIGRSVSSMAKKIKTLTEELYKQKLLKREAELKSLQSQINPHFLYNALEKIKGIAELEGSRKSAEMITVLGRLFRLNLSRGKDMITIKQEVEHMELYLSLQSLGRREKYNVDVEIEEGIEDCVIIKLTLQPLIENAITHGLENMVGRNKISVRGYRYEQDIYIEIFDDGRGMDSERLNYIQNLISGTESSEIISERGSGIALKNVNDRIRLYFGKNYGITLSSEENIGTTVVVRIPMISFDEWEEKHEVTYR